MTDQPEKKSKIVVDEDWKTRAQAEKEELQRRAGKEQEKDEHGTQAADTAGRQTAAELPELPADFNTLIGMLATQAMLGLGQLPNPITGKTEVSLRQAKHSIDLLGVLEAKSEGNRTAEESAGLSETLHHLRLAYIQAQASSGTQSSAPAAAGEQASSKGDADSGAEIPDRGQ